MLVFEPKSACFVNFILHFQSYLYFFSMLVFDGQENIFLHFLHFRSFLDILPFPAFR